MLSYLALHKEAVGIIKILLIIIHGKNSFGLQSYFLSLKESRHTVQNKDDLDIRIKTKT